jgi:NADP-dependent aldehyde dehydrogenase
VTSTVLVTGAAGAIGRHLRATLAREGRTLRLLDVAPMALAGPTEDVELVVASITDAAALAAACEGVEAVIHLGGLSTGGFAWAEYLEVNVDGTRTVLEAARRAGAGRVVIASSHHVMGRAPVDTEVALAEYDYPRPDSFYAVSKVAGEALGSLYHDRHGLDVVCLRIGSYRERPTDRRALWNWLSPGDSTRLFEAALDVPSPGFRVVWGVSANRRRIASLEEATAIGYVPLDDANDYAEEVLATPDASDPAVRDLVGGAFAVADFDEPRSGDAPASAT